jgi:rRNA-processing protein FCF1
MMDCLYAECKPCITDCVMAELEKLGQKYRLALKVAKVRPTQVWLYSVSRLHGSSSDANSSDQKQQQKHRHRMALQKWPR